MARAERAGSESSHETATKSTFMFMWEPKKSKSGRARAVRYHRARLKRAKVGDDVTESCPNPQQQDWFDWIHKKRFKAHTGEFTQLLFKKLRI